MKRQIKLILIFLALTAVLAGCGKDAETSSGNGGLSGSLTRGEWIGMLGDAFGYNEPFEDGTAYADVSTGHTYYRQIQACAEWEVITEEGDFRPDTPATWEYALQTAVRAVGVERITGAGLSVSEESLVDFFQNNIANTGDIDLGSVITAEDAGQVLEYALDYLYDLAPVERFEYTYNDGVYEAAADDLVLSGDGSTATVQNGVSYQSGDVIYIAPSAASASAAIRVTGVSGNQITYVEADVEDVYSELQISGSYDAVVLSVESANADDMNVSYHNAGYGALLCMEPDQKYMGSPLFRHSGKSTAIQTGASFSGNSAHFDTKLGGKGTFSIDISNIKVNTDIDFGIIKGLKKADATITFNDKITVRVEDHFSQSIPLGKVKVQLGTTPCDVEISLVLNIGMDGEATLTYTSKVVGSIGYKKGCGLSKSLDNKDSTLDFHAEATITAEPTVKVDLRLFGKGIANLKVTTGVVGIATVDVDLMGEQPSCIDIYLYVPLRWAVNEDGCIMTNISSKLKHSQTVWNSENSKVTERYHWEDNQLVDACTRGQGDEVETPVVDEEGQPYDEYKIFDFEELEFGIIRTASIQIFLHEGESMSIGITEVPSGYQASQLVYTVDTPSVCSISGGTVSAVGNGSTTVKISTPDGKYSTYITVTVSAGYNDTSGFQNL